MTVCFYVSGHGFGHASRVIEVINAVHSRRPKVRILVRTTAPPWLFTLTADGAVEYHHTETDTGVVQIDSLHLDAEATVLRAREFMRSFEPRVTAEAAFLRDQDVTLVVADLPPLGIAAAKRAGVPAIALGNFTWDWIYSAYPDTEDLVRSIGAVYAGADVAWRLPMHGGFASMQHIVDLPFVARRSIRDPEHVREALGLPMWERLVLVSFGGYGLAGLNLDALSRLDGYVAMVSGGVPSGGHPVGLRGGGRRGSLLSIDAHAIYSAGCRYEDLVRAVDVVVSKPGYGIIAECVANDTALLYTSRGHFIEYDVLVTAMPEFLRTQYIGHADLFEGKWQTQLDSLLAQGHPPQRPAVNGADVAAALLLDMI